MPGVVQLTLQSIGGVETVQSRLIAACCDVLMDVPEREGGIRHSCWSEVALAIVKDVGRVKVVYSERFGKGAELVVYVALDIVLN